MNNGYYSSAEVTKMCLANFIELKNTFPVFYYTYFNQLEKWEELP